MLLSPADFIPPIGKGSLYLRPLLLGSGPILGLGPAPSYTFTVFGAAVGAYFKVRQISAMQVCSPTSHLYVFLLHEEATIKGGQLSNQQCKHRCLDCAHSTDAAMRAGAV
jgi:branched-subunit amino acid aminotransferase/4-amino-4-deoxychorismate lyase